MHCTLQIHYIHVGYPAEENRVVIEANHMYSYKYVLIPHCSNTHNTTHQYRVKCFATSTVSTTGGSGRLPNQ